MSIHINEAISPVVIKAVQGDITDIETDAMVNSVNTAMVLGGTRSVASRINELTEGRLESILSNDDKYPKPVPLGEVCVTESDELPCSFVFHLSTHGNLEEMVNAANELGYEEELPDRLQIVLLDSIKLGVENLLRECEEHCLERMTIPLIGSGSLNLPKLLAMEVMVGTLSLQLLGKTPEYLREIKIITPEKSSFDFIEVYLENIELEVSSNNGPDLMMSGEPPSLVSSKMESKEFLSNSLKTMDSLDVEEPESSQSVAFEAMGEISSLKSELRASTLEKSRLEKQNQEYSAEIKILLEHNRELKREILSANRMVSSPEEVWFRSDLPLPLAYAHDILSSEEDPNRRYLLSTASIGIVHKYFFSLVCAEYKAAECFDQEVNEQVNRRFRQNSVTEGSWHWIGLLIAKAFKYENRNGKVIADFVELWLNEDGSWSRFSEVLKGLINLRNEIHDLVIPDNAWALEWLAKFSPLWEEMCTLSASLLNYELVFIDSIQNFLPGGRYLYTVKHLRGGYFAPQSGPLDFSEQYNPGELFLWDPVNDGMLALSPFMVYEYSQVTNSREAYCLDHITQARFYFRAFRYLQFHYEDRRGVVPFSN